MFTGVRGRLILRNSPGFRGSYYGVLDQEDGEDRPQKDGQKAYQEKHYRTSSELINGASVRALSTTSSATLASMAATDAVERNVP